VATLLLYFVIHILLVEPKGAGIFLTAPSITGALATPLWVAIGRKVGKSTGYFSGFAIAVAVCLPVFFISPAHPWLFLILLLVWGVGDAALQVFPNAMVPDTVEADELRSGVRREGAIFGAWGLCRKIGMTSGAFLVSLALSAIGFEQEAQEQSSDTLQRLQVTYGVLPLVLWIVAILAFHRYRLNEAAFDRIKAQIDARASLVRHGK
jgi:GPH family glycoside/pentoside/hexuronide:cation symporter